MNDKKKDRDKSNRVIELFMFENIMNNLKSAIAKNQIDLSEYDEIVWLLKYVLKSSEIFSSTKDVEIFLGNICGFMHDTKNTGRDRIVDWYFRELSKIEDDYERWTKIKRIAKYSFASVPNDFKGWKNILEKKRRT